MTSFLTILALVAVGAAVYYYYNYNKTNKPVAPISEPKTPKVETGGGSEDISLEVSEHNSIKKMKQK